MDLPLLPGVTFEPGRFHTLLGPPECVTALLDDPVAARLAAACICPAGSALADRLEAGLKRCSLRRVRTARELLREVASAREAIVVVEYAPGLCEGDGAVRRSLGHQLRALSAFAMVVLYAGAPDPAFTAIAGRADRSFVLVCRESSLAQERRLPPGQTTLT